MGYPNVLNRLGVPLYSIPLRALYSRNVRNLLTAGRDLSATHMAHSSTRVMLTCAVIGQAAGTMAAQCLAHDAPPAALHPDHTTAVQQSLLRHDVYVPGVANADPADLARTATVSASSESALLLPEEGQDWYACTEPVAMLLPLSAGRLDRVSLRLENRSARALPVRIWLRPAEHVWDAPHCDPVAVAEARVAPGARWVELAPELDGRPGLFWLGLEPQDGLFWRYVPEPPIGINAMRCPPATEATAFTADPKFGGRWSPVVSGYRFFGAFAVRISPQSRPYAPAAVLSGVTRPERWPNCWISDPAQPVSAAGPQWLQLTWARPVALDTVQITFDTRVRGSSHQRPTFSSTPPLRCRTPSRPARRACCRSSARPQPAGSPPDLVMNNREYLPALANEGTLEPLEPYMAAARITSNQFLDLDVKMCQWTGKTYGLPVLTAGANGITFYNATHLQELGLSPDRLPTAWPDYQSYAKRLTGGPRWGGTIRGGISGFVGYLLPHKGKYASEDGRRLLFGDALGLDVMTLVGQFYEPLGGLARVPGVAEGAADRRGQHPVLRRHRVHGARRRRLVPVPDQAVRAAAQLPCGDRTVVPG